MTKHRTTLADVAREARFLVWLLIGFGLATLAVIASREPPRRIADDYDVRFTADCDGREPLACLEDVARMRCGADNYRVIETEFEYNGANSRLARAFVCIEDPQRLKDRMTI